jgi:multicomponent Na+:H+ antiporter subunit G
VSTFLEIASLALLTAGVFFLLVGSIGLIRLPDFYTRIHAAAKSDTLGLGLAITGLAIHQGLTITTGKLLVVVAFVAITNPVGIHALARAAHISGLETWYPGRTDPRDPMATEDDGGDDVEADTTEESD